MAQLSECHAMPWNNVWGLDGKGDRKDVQQVAYLPRFASGARVELLRPLLLLEYAVKSFHPVSPESLSEMR